MVNLESFIRASAKLTDFSSFELQGTGCAESYYTFLCQAVGDKIVEDLISIMIDLPDKHQEQIIRNQVLGDERLGPVARGLIKLWYSGAWTALPAQWQNEYGIRDENKNQILSTSSYKEGLVWRAIGAHPSGAKQQGFGAWALPPLQEGS